MAMLCSRIRRLQTAENGLGLDQRLKLLKFMYLSKIDTVSNQEVYIIKSLSEMILKESCKMEENEEILKFFIHILNSRNSLRWTENKIISEDVCMVMLKIVKLHVENNWQFLSGTRYCQLLDDLSCYFYLISKYDVLIELLMTLCDLIDKHHSHDNIIMVKKFLLVILEVFIIHQRQTGSYDMIKNDSMKKLLLKLMRVNIHITSKKEIIETELSSTIILLFLSTFFHSDEVSSRQNVDVLKVNRISANKHLKTFLDLLHGITHETDEKKLIEEENMEEIICQFIPVLFREFLHLNRYSTEEAFSMLEMVCGVLGFSNTDGFTSKIDEKPALKALLDVLIVAEEKMSHVSIDLNEKLLKFYKLNVNILMAMNVEWFECVTILVKINHNIIEPSIVDILVKTWFQNDEMEYQVYKDLFISQLVTTYNKLHQENKIFQYMFDALLKHEKPNIIIEKHLYKSIRDLSQGLHPKSLMNLLHSFLSVLTESFTTLLKSTNATTICRWKSLLELFHVFIINSSIIEDTSSCVEHYQWLTTQLHTQFLLPLKNLCLKKEEESLKYSLLLLLNTHHQLYLTLIFYTGKSSLQDGVIIDDLSEIKNTTAHKNMITDIKIQELRKAVYFNEHESITVQCIEDLLGIHKHTTSGKKKKDKACRKSPPWCHLLQILPFLLGKLQAKHYEYLCVAIVHEILSNNVECEESLNLGTSSNQTEILKFICSPQIEEFPVFHSCLVHSIISDILHVSQKNVDDYINNLLKGKSKEHVNLSVPVLFTLQKIVRHHLNIIRDNEMKEKITYICIVILDNMCQTQGLKDDSHQLFSDWISLLTTIIQQLTGNLFHKLQPICFLNWIRDTLMPIKLKEDGVVRSLISTSLFVMFSNYDILSTFTSYINKILRSVLESEEESDRRSHTIAICFVRQLIHIWNDTTTVQNIKLKCEEYLIIIQNKIERKVSQIEREPSSSINDDLIQMVSLLLPINCLHAETKDSLQSHVGVILNTILTKLKSRQINDVHIDFILTIYSHHSNFTNILTKSTFLTCWNLVLSNLTLTQDSLSGGQDTEKSDLEEDCELKRYMSKLDRFRDIWSCFLSLLSDEELDEIMNHIVTSMSKPHKNIQQFILFLTIWTRLLPHRTFILNKTIFPVLLCCNHILESIKECNMQKNWNTINMLILKTFKTILSEKSYMLDGKSIVLCLNSCKLVNLDDPQFVTSVYTAISDVLFNILVNYSHEVKYILPNLLNINKNVIFQNGSVHNHNGQTVGQVTEYANFLTRLFMNYNKHKSVFSKVSPYLIVDYCVRSQKVMLHTSIKLELQKAMYLLLDICDEHRIKQLKRILPHDVQYLFVKLLNNYQKFHKYSGKF